MTRTKTRVLLLLAAAAFVPADRAFLWLAQRSVCAFDPCKPMTLADFWWVLAIQIAVLLVPAAFSFTRKPTPFEDRP